MDQKYSFDEQNELDKMMKPFEGQSASQRRGSVHRILIITLILLLVAVMTLLSSGCGKTQSGNSDQQTEVSDSAGALDQKSEELKQETEELEQQLEEADQELKELKQQNAPSDLSDSQYVGVWEATLIEVDGEYVDLTETDVHMEYQLNTDGTAKVIATGYDDMNTTWEEQDGTLVIKRASGEEPDLTGKINSYGQLILHNETENSQAVFEKH